MSIRSSFIRSKDDFEPFETKSYSSIDFAYEGVQLDDFLKVLEDDTKQRIFDREYSIDHAKQAIRIFDNGGKAITVNQLRDIFDDVGFNVDVSFTDIHNSDILMAYNIGGYVLPFYRYLGEFLSRVFPKYRLLFLYKLSPGKKRLHCRFYHLSDSSWLMTSHVDHANWMRIGTPKLIIDTHLKKAGGDYEQGSSIMNTVIDMLKGRFKEKKLLFIDIEKECKEFLTK